MIGINQFRLASAQPASLNLDGISVGLLGG